MNQTNYTIKFTVDESAEKVFQAINNVRAWWSEEIEGNTNIVNEEWDYHYQDVHRCKLKTIELSPNKKVVWQVMENYFSFTKDKSEWIGNKISFEITEENNQSIVKFTQFGLIPAYECYYICENAWNTYLTESLYQLIKQGKGNPNSKENAQTEDEKTLSSADFTSSFFVKQNPDEVFQAINNVRAWWQGEKEGNTDLLENEFTYRMADVHYSKQRIVTFIPNQKIEWLITESQLNFTSNKAEWTGTKIIFEISEINNKTQVRLTHVGLNPAFECYGGCSSAWEKLFQESLFSLITTGKGTQVFG